MNVTHSNEKLADHGSMSTGDYVIANFDVTNLYGPQQDWDHGLGGPIDGVPREYVPVPASAIVKIPKSTKLSWPQLAVSIKSVVLLNGDCHSAAD